MRAAPGRNVALMMRAEQRLQARLSAFFAGRARYVAEQVARQLGLSKTSPDDDRAAAIIAGLDLGDWSEAEDAIADIGAEVYADGYLAGAKLVRFGVSTDQVNERSVAWVRQHAAELVRDLKGNTRDMLRATVVRAIEEGWGTEALGDEIADSPGFSDARAATIGRTEVIAANNRGNYDAYADSGVVERVEWLTAHDDLVEEICEDNEAAGAIPLGEGFPSGDDCPPAHPNCRCALIPVLDEGD